MTYQSQIAVSLEKEAEKRRAHAVMTARSAVGASDVEESADMATSAQRVDDLAAQFKAGDYDTGLMSEYSALSDDSDRTVDLSRAADEVMAEMGFTDAYLTPDDVLDEILVRAGRA